MPAVLVEAGFINSDTDNELFDSNLQDIAQAIATGVLDTLKCRSSERTGNAGGTDEVPYSGRTVPEPNNAARQQETLEDRDSGIYDQWKQYYSIFGEYDMLDEAVAAQRRLTESRI